MMKRVAIALMVMLVVVMGAVTLTGCSAEGTYYLESITFDGETVKAGEEKDGVKLEKDYIKLELKADGKAVYTTMGVPVECKWEKSGSKIIVEVEFMGMSSKTEFKKSGSKLIAEEDGEKIVLKKG